MNATIFFAVIAGLSLVVYIISSIIIVSELKKRGIKINFIFIRLLIPFYVHKYKKLTIEESGRAGKMFYLWVVSINSALVFGIAAIISKAA